MSITVIGAVTKDTLFLPKGDNWKVKEQLGGILYPISALSALSNKEICPVCNVGYDIYEDVIDKLKNFSSITPSQIDKVEAKNIHSYILFATEYGTQYDSNKEVPITSEQIIPVLPKSDFVLFSPMTGFDISLSAVKKIENIAECPIYLDYHILSLDRDKLGNRFLHKRDDWLEWCRLCDHLQMNRFEAELLNEGSFNSRKDILHFCSTLINKGVTSIALTLGERGAFFCWGDKTGQPSLKKIKAPEIKDEVDPTGCGDVFAAGFISNFLETNDLLGAYQSAVNLAANSVRVSGIEKIEEVLAEGG